MLPKPGSDESFVQFKNHDKQYKAPFVIYADFEVEPATGARRYRPPRFAGPQY